MHTLFGRLGGTLDKNSRIPLYFQLMEKLIETIHTDYEQHEKLPSERELCDMYNVSRITVRQALQELAQEGYIYKQHGKGTFVAPKSYTQPLVKLYSFTEEMKKLGKFPTTKVLSFEKIAVDERMARKLQVAPLDEVFQIVRLRLADDEPLMYETSYVPYEQFSQLTKQDIIERPMYTVFQEDYRIAVTKAVERFTATSIRTEAAQHLQVASGEAAMQIKRYAYAHDLVIEYTVSIARGDKFDYIVELT